MITIGEMRELLDITIWNHPDDQLHPGAAERILSRYAGFMAKHSSEAALNWAVNALRGERVHPCRYYLPFNSWGAPPNPLDGTRLWDRS